MVVTAPLLQERTDQVTATERRRTMQGRIQTLNIRVKELIPIPRLKRDVVRGRQEVQTLYLGGDAPRSELILIRIRYAKTMTTISSFG